MEILIEFAQKDGKKPHKTGQNRTSAGGHGTVSGNWTALFSPPRRTDICNTEHVSAGARTTGFSEKTGLFPKKGLYCYDTIFNFKDE